MPQPIFTSSPLFPLWLDIEVATRNSHIAFEGIFFLFIILCVGLKAEIGLARAGN